MSGHRLAATDRAGVGGTAGPGPLPDSAARVRIVAIGDSTTAGTPRFRSPREAPPLGGGDITSQYGYWLMQAHPDWEVLNRGVDGERSDQVSARFERDVIAEAPAVMVLIAGVNDIYQGRPAAAVIDQLQWMHGRAAAAGIGVVAGTILPFNTATALHNARMREVNAWLRQQSERGILGLADTRAAVSPAGNVDVLSHTEDQLHPTPAGYRDMADAIGPVIARILR